MNFISTVNEIHKTKRLDKLLRLSQTLIENNAIEEFKSCHEKIESFNQSKSFPQYIKKICLVCISYNKVEFLDYILKLHSINKNFELFFALIYQGIFKANLSKVILNHFKLNIRGKYSILLLIFINKPHKKEAKRILKYLDLDYTQELPFIFNFLIETNQDQFFKKYLKHEYGFSDFLCEYDYKHEVIRHYNTFKDKLCDFDKHIYYDRYKLYLKEIYKNFKVYL